MIKQHTPHLSIQSDLRTQNQFPPHLPWYSISNFRFSSRPHIWPDIPVDHGFLTLRVLFYVKIRDHIDAESMIKNHYQINISIFPTITGITCIFSNDYQAKSNIPTMLNFLMRQRWAAQATCYKNFNDSPATAEHYWHDAGLQALHKRGYRSFYRVIERQNYLT